MVVVVPVALAVPSVIDAVPPPVVAVPAALALGVQVAAAAFGLGAPLAVMANGFVEASFRFLEPMLAFLVVIVGAGARGGREQQGPAQGSGQRQAGCESGHLVLRCLQSCLPCAAIYLRAESRLGGAGQSKDPASGESRSTISPWRGACATSSAT